GVRVDIDTSPLRKGPDGLSRWHCAVGTVHYEDVDPQAVSGVLVFLRSSLTGDEPADVRNYSAVTPAFPHHSTVDQFFDEAQFESYRALGYHIGREVFGEAAERLDRNSSNYRAETRKLFGWVRRRWFPPPPRFNEQFLS